MKIMNLFGLYKLFNGLLMLVALGAGGYALWPFIGITVFPAGMIILLIYTALETSFYVRFWYLVHDAEVKQNADKD